MSKILAQGMITLTQLYEGVQVILTPTAVLIPCDSEETPKPNAYINASTNVKAFLGTMDITSGITLGELEYSDSTVKASKTGTKVSITTITTRTGYVDIPVSATINGETIDLGKHRFNFVKQIDGQPGIPGDPGFGYTLNIKGGTRGVAYAANGTNPEPNTSSQFSVELLKNGVKVANPASISWTCGGNLSGASSVATFTPAIKSTYASGSSYVKVSVKEFAASLAVEETIPIICTKHADGLDWINEWNDKYVQVGTEKIITPKIFAGTKNSENELTGVAIGRDVLGGNANKVIGIVGYKKNTPVFSLDQDANFFVSSSGSAGDVKNGTNNAKGLYFDGNDLYISGRVRINGGSTIGENNTSVEEVINNSNLGAQANNKLDNLSIGGRNLVKGTAEPFVATHTELNKITSKGLPLSSYLQNNKNIIRNKYITFSIDVKTTNLVYGTTNPWVGFELSVEGNTPQWLGIGGTTIKAGTSDGFVRYVRTTKVNDMDITGLSLVTLARDCTGTVELVRWQIEIGSKASDWTPAPEDIDSAIDSKANSADVYKKTETYTKSETESAIEVAKDEINLGISSTYETKENVETKVSNAINDIKIGARNLFKDTRDYGHTSGSAWNNSSGSQVNSSEVYNGCKVVRVTSRWGRRSQTIACEKDAEYVISAWVKGGNTTTSIGTYCEDASIVKTAWAANVAVGTAWKRYWGVVRSGSAQTSLPIRIEPNNSSNCDLYICGLMVEKGNKPSEWSPNPEDIDSEINKKANSSDVYRKTEVYTKEETNSQINVAKDNINLAVSNTYETKANVETKVNNAVNNIEVGGRNLLTNCAKYTSSSPLNTQSASKDGYHLHPSICTPIELEVGTYVIQAETNGTWSSTHSTGGVDSSRKYCSLWLVSTTNGNNVHLFIDMTRKVCTVNIPVKGFYHLRTNTYSDNINNVSVNFWNIKLEKGNKKTGYSPAIEDVQSNIDKKANSTDVYTKSEVFTKAETNSAINIAKEEINLGVSQTYETKSNVESKISTAVNNVQIGGRNLWRFTKEYDGTKYTGWVDNNNASRENIAPHTTVNGFGVQRIAAAWIDRSQRVTIEPNTNYTLSAWVKWENTVGELRFYTNDGTMNGTNVTPQVGTADYKRVSITFNSGNATVSTCRFECSSNTPYLIYGLKLEKGNKASDWTPAPEDVQANIDKKANSTDVYTKSEVYTKTETNSQISATTDAITSRVSSLESKEVANRKVAAFRYVRDWLRGSSANPGNHWVELQVWENGSNIAQGKTVTTNGTHYPDHPINRFTDDNTSTYQYAEVQNDGSWRYLQVDLGEIHYNIDYLRVWHYYDDLRRYNHKLEVSVDGSTWYTIYNSDISGAYTETADGRVHIINETSTEKRLKTAESKITDSAIINTVSSTIQGAKNEAINSANSSTDNKLQSYATNSSLTQTAKDITAKFEASGGYNLLQNSGFKTGDLSRWWIQHHNNPTGSWNILNSSATWGFPDSSVNCCQIRMSNQSGKEYGIAQTFSTTIGKKYTVSLYYAGHRVSSASILVRNPNASWLANKSFNPSEKSGGNSNISNWGTISLTFTATQTSHMINVVLHSAENDGYLWIAKPQIVEGEVALPYSPHPNEIYSGSTVIDADGVTINNGALRVKDGNGNLMLEGDSSGTLYLRKQLKVGTVGTFSPSGINITGGSLTVSGGTAYKEPSVGYSEGSTTSQSLYNNGLYGSSSSVSGSQIHRADSFYGSNGWSIYEDNSGNALQQSYKTYSRGSGIYIQATDMNKGGTGSFVEATRLNHEGLITTGSITVGGQITTPASGALKDASGRIFLRNNNNGATILSNNSGTLYLRPNGDTNTNSQFTIGTDGTATINNGVKLNTSYQQSGNCLRINTGQGTMDIGPQNTNHCHFNTSAPNFYYYKPIIMAAPSDGVILRNETGTKDYWNCIDLYRNNYRARFGIGAHSSGGYGPTLECWTPNSSNFFSRLDVCTDKLSFYKQGGDKAFNVFVDSGGHGGITIGSTSTTYLKWLRGTAQLQVRNYADNGYTQIVASSFTNGSKREFKDNIGNLDSNIAKKIIMNNEIRTYNLKNEIEEMQKIEEEAEALGIILDVEMTTPNTKAGLILEDLTPEADKLLHPERTEGIDIYAMASVLWKHNQSQQVEIDNLIIENKELKTRLETIEKKLGLS